MLYYHLKPNTKIESDERKNQFKNEKSSKTIIIKPTIEFDYQNSFNKFLHENIFTLEFSWRKDYLGCSSNWSPKFSNNFFLFVSLNTLRTFFEF